MLAPLPCPIQPAFKGSSNLTQEQQMALQKAKLEATARIVAGYAHNQVIANILSAIPNVYKAIDTIEFNLNQP